MKPSIGRTVLFHPTPGPTQAAIIAHVHSDTLVNLTVFDSNGVPSGRTSVPFVGIDQPKPEFSNFASWMPYQAEQAKKQSDPVLFPVERSTAEALTRIIERIDVEIAERS